MLIAAMHAFLKSAAEKIARLRRMHAVPLAAAGLAGCVFSSIVAAQTGTLTPPAMPVSSSVQLAAAKRLMDEGHFAQAEATLRPLIAAQPNAAEPHYLLAYALLRENKPDASLNEYTRAATLRTPSAAELRSVALAYVLLNDIPDADRWLARSLAMDDKDTETWYAIGRLRYTQGRYGVALECFQKTLSLNPRSVKGENNLGLAYEALNRNDDAVRAYRTAIGWQKDDPHPSEQPLLNLAILLQHRDQWAEAQQLLSQAVAIAPNDSRIHENLGQIYLHQTRAADAVAQFETAVTLAPQNARYHYLLGQAYHRNGMAEQARQEFARSAALNGTHSTSPQE